MPAYAVPTDTQDLLLLANHNQQKGQWVVIYSLLPTEHYVYGNFKSWRLAQRISKTLTTEGRVYWCDGTQFWLAT